MFPCEWIHIYHSPLLGTYLSMSLNLEGAALPTTGVVSQITGMTPSTPPSL